MKIIKCLLKPASRWQYVGFVLMWFAVGSVIMQILIWKGVVVP